MKTYDELKNLVNSLESDVQKFENDGNAAAGTRVRQALQNVKLLSQELRVEIQTIKNGRDNA